MYGGGDGTHSLGGGQPVINEVQHELDWSVVVSQAKGKGNLRPDRVTTGKVGKKQAAAQRRQAEEGNRFSPLLEELGHMEEVEKSIFLIENNCEATVDQVRVDGEWERIPLKIDSGAVDTVIPKCVAETVPTQQTQQSLYGAGFRAANGTPIKHFGQKTVMGCTDQGEPIKFVGQVADVRTPLCSVHQMMRGGNQIHFEKGNCFIKHSATGKVTQIVEKDGAFEVGVWIQKRTGGEGTEQPFHRQAQVSC